MKKILSITLSLLIVITSMSFATTAFAASKLPATSITSLSAKYNGFTVKWKKKTKITGYQIQYSTSSKFNKKSTKTVKIKKAKTTSKKITNLKSSKKYYVRIRTYKNSKKKTNYSAWSKKKSVTASEPYWCDEGGSHHVISEGIGWYKTYSEAEQAANIGDRRGHHYEIQECDCGLFTCYINYNDDVGTTTQPTTTEVSETSTTQTTQTSETSTTEPTTKLLCNHNWAVVAYISGEHLKYCTLCGAEEYEKCQFVENVVNPTCENEGYTI